MPDHALPDRQQPLTTQDLVTTQGVQPFGSMDRDIGHATLGRIEFGPGLLQLGRVMGTGDEFDRQTAQYTLGRHGRQGTVLGQQARSLQARHGTLRHARRLQAHAQCQRAPGGSLAEIVEHLQCGSRVPVVQGPPCGTQLHAFPCFRGYRVIASPRQRGLPVLVARLAVLQGVRCLGGQQV